LRPLPNRKLRRQIHGRIEIGNNSVERIIRLIALNSKYALFTDRDTEAENGVIIASLIKTCKPNAVEPLAHLTTVHRHRQ